MVVVLPDPFGPSSAYTVPSGTRMSTPSSTWFVPYAFRRPVASTIMCPSQEPITAYEIR